MRVAVICTYASGGGAALSARRWHQALRSTGHEAALLVQQGASLPHEQLLPSTRLGRSWRLWADAAFTSLQMRHRKEWFDYAANRWSYPLHAHPVVQAADVVNLHWSSHGLMGAGGLARLARLGKPIVWTLQDCWAFTGGCYHPKDGCTGYERQCGQCPYLWLGGAHDLSARQWKQKYRLWPRQQLAIHSPSQWLANTAQRASLLKNTPIHTLPNPLDCQVFQPADKARLRVQMGLNPEAPCVVFGAARLDNPYKGLPHLLEALRRRPIQDLQLVVFGHEGTALQQVPPGVTVHRLGVLKEPQEVVNAYSVADVTAMPTQKDTYPYTVLESLACGTPVVGYAVGGVPEMVEHLRTGYMAPPGNVDALAEGLYWALADPARRTGMSLAARQQVLARNDYPVIGQQFAELLRGMLAAHKQ